MVTFQSAIHGEEELEILINIVFTTKQMKNIERACVYQKVLKNSGDIWRFCCVPTLKN